MIKLSPSYTAEEIIHSIRKYNTVSFDIFDTLIKRSFAVPKDVFIKVAEEANRDYGLEIIPEDFQKCRIESAKMAKAKALRCGHEEISLYQIYEEIPENYKDFKKKLFKLEIEREIACCTTNFVMKKVFDWCIHNKKKVYIISDMYLPKETIEEILLSCGYIGYDKLYLSSEVGVKKQTGKLFDFAKKDSSIVVQHHIHIGDNFKTDYLAAKKVGINSYKIPTNVSRSIFNGASLKFEKNIAYKKILTVINNCLDPNENDFYKYGFEVVGIALLGFISWLHENCKKAGYKKVFFLSRDGFLMQKAYNELYGNESIPNGYLYVSRKSLFLPQLWMTPVLQDILEPETPYRYWNCKEFCGLLGINYSEGKKKWIQLGIEEDERFTKPKLLVDKRISYFFEYFKDEIIKKSKQEFDIVISYLKQEGFNGKVAIVDIGWAGAIQKYLNKYIQASDIDASIYGYYFGFKQKTVMGLDAISYIPKELNPSLFCSQLIEYPFTNRVGTTKKYVVGSDGKVIVVLDDYEFINMPDSEYTAEMQRGIKDFIHLMKAGYGGISLDYSVAYRKLRKITKMPTLRNVKLLGNLAHVNHGHTSYLAKPKSVIYYMYHPQEFKLDFSYSGWKIGFVKKIFRLPLPYNWVLEKIRGNEK